MFAQGSVVQGAPSTPQHTGQLAVVATLNKNLDAKKAKAGDKVTARIIQDLIISGKLVIPRQSKLVGHVVDVRALTKNEAQSRLTLVFDIVQLKKGSVLSLRGVLQALSPPLYDQLIEAALSSPSPYGSGGNGPANRAMISAAQITNPPYTSDQSQSSGARALKNEQRGMENSNKTRAPGAAPRVALDVSSRGVFGIPGLYLLNTGSLPSLVAFGRNLDIESGSQLVVGLESLSAKN